MKCEVCGTHIYEDEIAVTCNICNALICENCAIETKDYETWNFIVLCPKCQYFMEDYFNEYDKH